MRKDKKEIRNLLLGKAVVDEEGRLVTPEAGTFRVPNGIADGAGAVRFLGVSGKTQCYESDLGEEELMARAVECMRSIGRGVHLRQHPDAAACLIRYVLTRPVLLVFRLAEGRGVLTAWTGRGIMSWASRMRSIRAFERTMGDAIRFSAAPPPEEEPEEKKRRRKRKKKPPEKAREEYGEAPEYADGEYADDYDEYPDEYADEYPDEYPDGYADENDDDYDGDTGEYADDYGEEYDGADEYGGSEQEEDGEQ